MKWRWIALAGVAVLVLALLARGVGVEKLTLKRGADAYLVGYPLVTMLATRDALVEAPSAMNAFTHARYLPDASSSVQVVAPSRDAYYSSAWLDLSEGPLVIEQPAMGDRFWLMPVLDAWTNVIADPGTRTLGNDPHRIVVTGPDWQGKAMPDATVYRSPTNLAWVILRIQRGPDIGRLQDGFRIAPLSDPQAYSRPAVYTAARSTRDVRATVDALSGEEFFGRLAQDLLQAPPDPEAAAILARVGVTPGAFEAPSGAAARGLAEVPQRVQAAMTEAIDSAQESTTINGWRVPPMILGAYGAQYPTRAVVAREGLGANLPADAVYASTTVQGGRTYTLDMPANMPVRAFWSVSLYDERGRFLPGGTRGLSVSGGPGEGPVRITVSPQKSPGAWLRSPENAPFRLLMRLYWPEQTVLDNQWPYPPVVAQP